MTNNNTVQKLDAETIPLSGNRLIEASAGTGKTYTIANLYLRLVVGHGIPVPLTVDQILVVTFTEAATEELRDRIRKRLQTARMAFEEKKSDDPFIQFLLDDLDRHPERARLLLSAERQMDEATVFTIHGFCQRMLKQHAFESGTLFSSELITDEHHLLQQTAADFWRRHFYSLNKPLARMARKLWKTPTDLLMGIRSYLGKHDLSVYTGQLPVDIGPFQKKFIQPSLAIKALWRQEQSDIEEQLLKAGLKKTAKPLKRLTLMAEFVQSDDLFPILGRNESWEIYSTSTLKKALAKGGKLPDHPVFQMIDELMSSGLSIQEAFKGMIINLALEEVRRNHHKNMADRHQMSFDDLLGNMQKALYGPFGDTLATAVRKQFQVAMIDEFQDTDPQQYAIFNKIYNSHLIDSDSDDTDSNSSDGDSSGLFMIGDPKQAIYAFRGADVFTYMEARKQVTAHYSLDTNWRSTSNMVNAVNRLFSVSNNPFIYEQIPFESVKPSKTADKKQLLVNNQPVPAVQLWLQEADGNAIGKGDYEEAMTLATASEIHRLLTLANSEKASITKEDKSESLQAGDIAVLVRTGRQGQMIRDALSEQGIASVYLSSNDSVFACQEAQDVLRLLAACLTPANDRILRSALASSVLNMTAQELDNLNQDEQAWENCVNEFQGYQLVWQTQGLLPMLRNLLRRRKIAEQLLSTTYGERRLTDFLHIGELLASASLELDSPHALYRWLSEHIYTPDSAADDQQLHLESERNLVQIVTIHKSKGLEYPVVFLPYICSFRETKEPLYHQDSKTILDLTHNDDSLAQAEKERLAEDLRLLYVALTRSVHSCYLGLAPLKTGSGKKGEKTDLHKSAIGYLLGNGDFITCAQLQEQLDSLTAQSELIQLTKLPKIPVERYQPPAEEKPELSAKSFSSRIEKDWWVTSYSALSKTSHSAPRHTTLDASMEMLEQDLESIPTEIEAEDETLDIFSFPKGARPGTFLHTLFEEYPTVAGSNGSVADFVVEQLTREGFEEHWSETLVEMLDHCLNTPLDGKDLTLGQLSASQQKAEMEFYLPVSRLNADELNTLLAHEDPLSARAGSLDFRTVKGMLKGFIDLTFEYQGRWYVLDYKSNWLGSEIDDYLSDSMDAVMIDHRYDLQYQIYSLALHRLLKHRLPDYDYEQHFGGVFYLFLRGVRKDRRDRPGIFQHRPSLSLITKLDSLFAGEAVC